MEIVFVVLPLLLLMAKSRRKKPENVRRYFKPLAEAIAEVTSPLAPSTATAVAACRGMLSPGWR